MHHIEPLAAQGSEAILEAHGVTPKDLDRIATHALHILAEQGVFALGLYLATRKRPQDDAPAQAIHREVANLLHRIGLIDRTGWDLSREDRTGFYRHLTEIRAGEDAAAALQRLLLTRQVIETLLLYARYGAKART
ncbi:MAG: hypothetical protein D6819_08915 [Gammaproteobacteria bacterium]|nr:MAG: hypothetical protein D6819_08915 [Gammaproteobacteria bacterium]